MNKRLLEITEKISTFNGIREHEIIFNPYAEFKNPTADTDNLKGAFNAEGKEIKLAWAFLNEISKYNVRLYPDCLLEIHLKEFKKS